jgi:hypothetical protein
MIRAFEPSRTPDRMKSGLGHPFEPFASCARLFRVIVGVRAMLSSDGAQARRARITSKTVEELGAWGNAPEVAAEAFPQAPEWPANGGRLGKNLDPIEG